ncbi:MAG TPA: transglutaminase family protein [Candidatus Aquilonibacter sp.]|nr:transglutaminase family protein [Candidatus Aquilonibacter sp.]
MQIRLGYDIRFDVAHGATFIALLRVHPSRQKDLDRPDLVTVSPDVPVQHFEDSFGNLAARFQAPAGAVTLTCETVASDSGELDPIAPDAQELSVNELPPGVLPYLLNSRYCEVDLLSPAANDFFGQVAPGWSRVQAICSWTHDHVAFDYRRARPTKTALEVFTERVGVCRDFQHLAITFCRALNIPARYVTGYLGDIGVPVAPYPMDFSAWFEAYIGGKWYTFDARHNQPRVGRIVMATGRDATDVAITTTFGEVALTNFSVITEEVGTSQ